MQSTWRDCFQSDSWVEAAKILIQSIWWQAWDYVFITNPWLILMQMAQGHDLRNSAVSNRVVGFFYYKKMCPGYPALITEKRTLVVVKACFEQWFSVPTACLNLLGKFFENINIWNTFPKILIELVWAWSSGFPGHSITLLWSLFFPIQV